MNDSEEKATPRRIEAIGLVFIASISMSALFILGPFHHGAQPSPQRDRPVPSSIKFAAAPTHNAAVIPGELQPIANYLESSLPLKVSFYRTKDIAATLRALAERRVDGAILPPIACTQALETIKGTKILAAQSFENRFTIDSLLVVRQDDSVKLTQLKSRSFCAAHPFSPSAALMTPLWMRSHGIEPEDVIDGIHWTGDPLDALRMLVQKRCDTVATHEAAFSVATSAGVKTSQLRILARTGHVPLPCWIASPRLDVRISHALSQALIDFDPKKDAGQPFIGEVLKIGRFRSVDTSTYRAIKVASQLVKSP